MNGPIPFEQQFAAAMAEHGLQPAETVADGKLHRFDGPEEKRGKRSAWYVLHGGGLPAGSFGDWRTGLSDTWSAKSDRAMTGAERQAHRKRIEQARAEAAAERAKVAEDAAVKCAELWSIAVNVDGGHAYIERKGIKPAGAKQLRDALLIPLRDIGGDLRSLQFIQADGSKRFKSGGTVAGSYCALGDKPGADMPLLICEGWATACSLHGTTGYPVAAAMNAGNLLAVAQALRAKLPDVPMIVCADDDIETGGNPGLTKAREAAQAVGARLAVPDFGPERPDGATDFNDLHIACGSGAVLACIEGASFSADRGELPARTTDAGLDSDLACELMPYYGQIDGGLHYVGVTRAKETGELVHIAPQWLCSALAVLGTGSDDSGQQYRIVEFKRAGDGEVIRHAMPARDIGEREGWSALRGLGLQVAAEPKPRYRLAEFLQREGETTRFDIVSLTGWQHGAYVLPSGELVGTPSRPMFYDGGTPKKAAYAPAGTLDTWRDTVGSMARENSLVAAAIACAFAGPLLSILGVRDGIGLHLHARTSSGKSTVGDCAASVWGNPVDVLHTWDGTSYGLARTAEYANDGLLYLDEIGAGDARKIGPAIYQMLNGVSRLQGTKDGGVKASRSWRLTMVSTGEVSMAQYLAEGGQTPRGGQEIRLLDVPADTGAYRAFDCLHGHKDGDAFATELTASARANYGTVGRAFVAWLAEHRGEVAKWVADTQADMLAAIEANHPDAAPPAKRATRKWGVLVAAAEMASDAGLTGWTRDEARTWVMAAWARWLEAFGTADRDNERLLEQVDGILAQNEHARFVRIFTDGGKGFASGPILGYVRYDNDIPTFDVLKSAFKDEVIAGFNERHACRVLHDAEMLLRPKGHDGWTTYSGKEIGRVYRLHRRPVSEDE